MTPEETNKLIFLIKGVHQDFEIDADGIVLESWQFVLEEFPSSVVFPAVRNVLKRLKFVPKTADIVEEIERIQGTVTAIEWTVEECWAFVESKLWARSLAQVLPECPSNVGKFLESIGWSRLRSPHIKEEFFARYRSFQRGGAPQFSALSERTQKALAPVISLKDVKQKQQHHVKTVVPASENQTKQRQTAHPGTRRNSIDTLRKQAQLLQEQA